MVQAIEIKNIKGYTLRGFLDLPENANELVVFCHGFTGNKTEHAGHFRNFSRILSKNNIASIRMDYHGNGESDGEFSDFIFEDALDDMKKCIEYAKNLKGIEKVDLLGFSLGGAVASLIVDNTINKLVLWSPAGSMVEHAVRDFETWRKLDNGNAYYAGFELSKEFVDSIKKFNMYQNAKNYHGKVQLIHGSKDLSVDPSCSYKYKEEFENANLYIVEGAGHGYDAYEQARKLYEVSLEFLLGNN